MKRLMSLMLACAALLVMGIAAAGVRAEGGSDDATQPTAAPAKPCDQRGENEANDDRFARVSSDGTRGDDRLDGRAGNDDEHGGTGDDDLEGDRGDDDLCGDDGNDDLN